MKIYNEPIMEVEVFCINEYISACKDTNLSCLNMNNAKVVYFDKNGNKVLDDHEKVSSNTYSFREQQDCGISGDPIGGKHSSHNLNELVFVGYRNNIFIPAYMFYDVKKDTLHFFRYKVNHSFLRTFTSLFN